ncbi:hypothetical protein [Streptomyces californicus]
MLHQRAGTTPAEGSAAAHKEGRALVTTIRADLPEAQTRAGDSGNR